MEVKRKRMMREGGVRGTGDEGKGIKKMNVLITIFHINITSSTRGLNDAPSPQRLTTHHQFVAEKQPCLLLLIGCCCIVGPEVSYLELVSDGLWRDGRMRGMVRLEVLNKRYRPYIPSKQKLRVT